MPKLSADFIARVNAKLVSPVRAGEREDEIAFDAYISGKSTAATAAEIEAHRAAEDTHVQGPPPCT